MKKLRELLAIMAILAVGAAMTGCGSDDDEPDNGGGTQTPQGNAPGSVQNQTFFFTPAGAATRSIVFSPSGNTYTIQSEGATAESGTYSYNVSSNNQNQATLSLSQTSPNAGEQSVVVLNFQSGNSGTYQLTRTPAGGGQSTTESGSFGTTNPGDNNNQNPTNQPTNNPNTNQPTNTNQNPTQLTVVGRNVQVQYNGGGQELFGFQQGGTFTSDFQPGAGGTYTEQASGTSAVTVNLDYNTPTAAANDTATLILTRTSDNGGTFTGNATYEGTQHNLSGNWSFAQ
ncbi:MAG TPA: hypothetical protein VEH27_10285 [Methylomirabilota bacterium]|nr:hypothetical protein [Methylomirabilota bacterium]